MHDAVMSALRADLGAQAGIGITDPREQTEDLWPQERTAILRAVPKRRCEFAAGRRAARLAMADCGLPPMAIPAGPQRAPLWPAGVAGSIAHCADLCIAAISTTHRSLGIDIEADSPLDPDLIPIICTKQEREWLATNPDDITAKQIFCLKEAIYKAQYPLTGRVIDFHALSVTPAQDRSFTVAFHTDIGPLPKLGCRVATASGYILATAVLG